MFKAEEDWKFPYAGDKTRIKDNILKHEDRRGYGGLANVLFGNHSAYIYIYIYMYTDTLEWRVYMSTQACRTSFITGNRLYTGENVFGCKSMERNLENVVVGLGGISCRRRRRVRNLFQRHF